MLAHPGFVRAAPTLPASPVQAALSFAILLRQDSGAGLSPPHGLAAPRGAIKTSDSNTGFLVRSYSDPKVLYLAIRELIEPKTRSKTHVAAHWKAALNAFSIYFQDRITLK
ncbi:hypothetical protein [Streptomyces sp. NPDC003952]